ncbi:MAG: hypothetical protein AAF564_17765 [Bacteroidota bacterium]
MLKEKFRTTLGLETGLDDDTKCLVLLRDALRDIADQAESRIMIKAQLNELLD